MLKSSQRPWEAECFFALSLVSATLLNWEMAGAEVCGWVAQGAGGWHEGHKGRGDVNSAPQRNVSLLRLRFQEN